MLALNIPCPICNDIVATVGNVRTVDGHIGVLLKVEDLAALTAAYSGHIVGAHTNGFKEGVRDTVQGQDVPENVKDFLNELFTALHPGHNED